MKKYKIVFVWCFTFLLLISCSKDFDLTEVSYEIPNAARLTHELGGSYLVGNIKILQLENNELWIPISISDVKNDVIDYLIILQIDDKEQLGNPLPINNEKAEILYFGGEVLVNLFDRDSTFYLGIYDNKESKAMFLPEEVKSDLSFIKLGYGLALIEGKWKFPTDLENCRSNEIREFLRSSSIEKVHYTTSNSSEDCTAGGARN